MANTYSDSDSSNRQLIPFRYSDLEIRVVRDDNGDPLFVAADVCKVLGISNPTDALRRLDDDEQALVSIEGISQGNNKANVVTESGLYSLILGSRKPAAKDFKRWITHEVIPSIRKTGSYAVKPMTPAEMLLYQAQRLVEQERRLADVETALTRIEARQTAIEDASDFFTILAFARLHNVQIDIKTAQRLGRLCGKLARERGSLISDVTDPRFGTIHTYHQDILFDVFVAVGLLDGVN